MLLRNPRSLILINNSKIKEIRIGEHSYNYIVAEKEKVYNKMSVLEK
jgi:hypothetical protein